MEYNAAEWTIYRFLYPIHYNKIVSRIGLWPLSFHRLKMMSKPDYFYRGILGK